MVRWAGVWLELKSSGGRSPRTELVTTAQNLYLPRVEWMIPQGSSLAWITCYPFLLPSISTSNYKLTHRAEMPQWAPDFFPAWMKSDSPMRLMVGAIARGPMNFSTNPTSPESPSTTWSKDATRIAPWIWKRSKHYTQALLLTSEGGGSQTTSKFSPVCITVQKRYLCSALITWIRYL